MAGKYLYVYGTMDEDGFYEGLACFAISNPKFQPDPTLVILLFCFHLTSVGSKYLLVMFAVWNKLNNFHGTVCMGCSCLVQIGAD